MRVDDLLGRSRNLHQKLVANEINTTLRLREFRLKKIRNFKKRFWHTISDIVLETHRKRNSLDLFLKKVTFV